MTRTGLVGRLREGWRVPPATASGGFTAAWLVASVAALLVVRPQVWRHVPLWSLTPEGWIEPMASALAGTAFALLVRGAAVSGANVATLVWLAALCYVPVFAILVYAYSVWSHVEAAASPLLGISLALLPHYTRSTRQQVVALSGLVICTSAAVLIGVWPTFTNAPVLTTVDSELYSLRVEAFPSMVPPSTMARGGALEPLGDGYLVAAADGSFYHLTWRGGRLESRRLALALPLGRDAFAADQRSQETHFDLRVTDMVLARDTQGLEVVVAHQAWDRTDRCMRLRVSRAALDLTAAQSASWRTVFQTEPCLPIESGFDDLEFGGRLAWRAESLLLSVGDPGVMRDAQVPLAQRRDASYGKVLRLAPDGVVTIFSAGHRNPQGLLVEPDGRVWSSEQGPRGGDELNLIAEGGNYGWPLVTYGTDYGSHEWALSGSSHDHGSFREPVMAFVPSMALSNLVRVGRSRFEHWNGDLVAGTLTRRSLVRVRLRADRAIYAEPIRLGYRIRDIAEDPSGRLVLWTDERAVVVVTPSEAHP